MSVPLNKDEEGHNNLPGDAEWQKVSHSMRYPPIITKMSHDIQCTTKKSNKQTQVRSTKKPTMPYHPMPIVSTASTFGNSVATTNPITEMPASIERNFAILSSFLSDSSSCGWRDAGSDHGSYSGSIFEDSDDDDDICSTTIHGM